MTYGTGYLVIGVLAFAIGIAALVAEAFCSLPH